MCAPHPRPAAPASGPSTSRALSDTSDPTHASLVCTVKIGAVDVYFFLDGQTWTLPVEQALSPDLA